MNRRLYILVPAVLAVASLGCAEAKPDMHYVHKFDSWATGPWPPPYRAGQPYGPGESWYCDTGDLDGDGDVDLADFAVVQREAK